MTQSSPSRTVLAGSATGQVLATMEALSFWGGVDPATGDVIDVHHPLHGQSLTARILLMPTSRGSCSGSGVLLDLILTGRGPAALVFCETEDVLTLGALIASEMFGATLPVIRVSPADFKVLACSETVSIDDEAIRSDQLTIPLCPPPVGNLTLTPQDEAMLSGNRGQALKQAMSIIVAMAAQQDATTLVDVSQGHIDGCIYASPANLIFAEKMAELGAKVCIPTTMNAISVDRQNWKTQGIPASFGEPSARLADAYVRMGCQPTFTCSPYLLESPPVMGETIAWAESNAVIFANTVLGARTAKHPDFLDLCIALTGRTPATGVYLDRNRRPTLVIDIDVAGPVNDAFWPLIGYLAGKTSPDQIPLLRGIQHLHPSRDDLKSLCAAFGTTSAAPMLHIEGITPEAGQPIDPATATARITELDLDAAWQHLNQGSAEIDLIAIGSPHASLEECHALAEALGRALDGQRRNPAVAVIVTAGRSVIQAAQADGTLSRLHDAGVQVLPDLCWCSISEPLFPQKTKTVLTNSGKYAHYGPGLSGRPVRLASLSDCVEAALTGVSPPRDHGWKAQNRAMTMRT